MHSDWRKRRLSAADIKQLARADALFDRLNPTQTRDAAEWLLVGLAYIYPTCQSLEDWLDALERHVRP